MIPKFKTVKVAGQWQTDIKVAEKYSEYKRTCKDGHYYFILFPEIKWNTDQMRKLFHVWLKFIVGEMRKVGYFTTEAQLKKDFKRMFGPKTEKKNLLGEYEPLSTSEYSHDEYHDLMRHVKEWCQEKLQIELPTIEEVAIETLKELNGVDNEQEKKS